MKTSFASDRPPFEAVIGHRFRRPALMEQALTHKSFAHERGTPRLHNESLEFLGDAVLGFVVTDVIYREFPGLNEGRKSKIKAFLVSASTLAQIALELDLPRYLRLGKGEEKTGGRKKRALSANAFEALVAAVYLDAGLAAARAFLDPLYRPLFRAIREGRAVVEDPKTVLQEYLQANSLEAARYSVLAETGPEHLKTFHVELAVGNRIVSRAEGTTKKRAELLAAKRALAVLLGEGERKASSDPTHAR